MKIDHNFSFADSWNETELAVSHSGIVVTDDSWKQKPLPSPFSRLYFITGGSGVLESDSQQMILEPGYVYLAPCGSACGFYGTDSVSKLFFHINLVMPNGYDLFSSCKALFRIPYAVSKTEQLIKWYRSNDTVKLTLLKCSIWEVISSFVLLLHPDSKDGGRYSKTVCKAMGYIREHLNAALTVKAVAEAVYCSSSTLSQAFFQEVGVSMARYIEDLVMLEAQWRLLESDKPIGQISNELGFCDQFYFARRFGKRFQMSPREYRKNRVYYENEQW